MSRKMFSIALVLSVTLTLFLTGCGSTANLDLKFSPDRTARYQTVTEVVKDFRFEQPNLNKLKEEQSRTYTELGYTQAIESVDSEGVATARITIDSLKMDITNKNENRLSFNSQDEKDAGTPLAALIGKSYTITLSPDGKASVQDAQQVVGAVTQSFEKGIVQSMMSQEAIGQRHGISALPEKTSGLRVNSTWTKVTASPPGLLAPKSFEKVYTLTDVSGDIATVAMTGGESAEPAQGTVNAGSNMGIFAKMFDSKDDYTGRLKMNLDSGEVLEFGETLVTSYVAQEMPQNGDPEKGPDTLMMRFTNRIEMTKLD